MSKSVTVIDYGVGNLHSVFKALGEVGAAAHLTGEPREVERAERLVLPGVGAFADGMAGLGRRNLVPALREYFARGRPFLGICLGMQMLLTESEEFGSHQGLDVIPGKVALIPRTSNLKVPHMGWNSLRPPPNRTWSGTVLETTPPGTLVYFVHSYTVVPDREEDRLADALYGDCRVAAAIQRGNVLGFQFHPEKSGPTGLAMLASFLRL